MNVKSVTGDRYPATGGRRRRSRVTDDRSPKQGLSLIEVLLALVIIGIGMTVLIATATKCISVARKIRVLETSRELLARVELEHPIQLEDKIEAAAGGGSFSYPDHNYRWERHVEPIGLEEDGLFEIRTTIKWSEQRQESSESVVTYLYVPKERRSFSLR
jgi:prepilin-type N-terminal cleavage/methylation domain-containing protein